jgi:hypothetical protein
VTLECGAFGAAFDAAACWRGKPRLIKRRQAAALQSQKCAPKENWKVRGIWYDSGPVAFPKVGDRR